jgi:tetratricopeptide (TPR) repeat protein
MVSIYKQLFYDLNFFFLALTSRLRCGACSDCRDSVAVITNIAQAHHALAHYENAVEYCERALALMGPTHDDCPLLYSTIAASYAGQGSVAQALASYSNSTKILLERKLTTHPLLLVNYKGQALVYRKRGRYDMVLECVENALGLLVSPATVVDKETRTTLQLEGGVACVRIGQFAKAVTLLTAVVEERESKLGVHDIMTAEAYGTLASAFKGLGDLPRARSLATQALEAYQTCLPATHPTLALSHDALGDLWRGEASSMALSHYRSALAIRAAAAMDLTPSYDNIGNVYRDMGDYAKALEQYSLSLQGKVARLGTRHIEVGDCYARMGILYKDNGSMQLARDALWNALDIFISTLGPQHHRTVAVNKVFMQIPS